MVGLLGRRLVSTVATVFVVTVVAFALVALMPGDPARIAAGEFGTPAIVEQIRSDLHLDQPVIQRYGSFVGDAVRGDLGTSVQVQPTVPVTTLIGDALPITATLGAAAIVIGVLIALPVGYFAAVKQGRWVDRVVTGLSSLFLAVPPFVLGLVLVVIFAVNRRWLPSIGYVSIGDGGVVTWLKHLTLPALTLAAVPAAELSRQVRGALVDTFEQDYIRTAVAKGLPRRRVIAKHAFKNAATPIVTVLGLQVARVMAGTVVVERIFAINGFGSLSYSAVISRDLPVIQGVVLVAALLVILINLAVEVTYGYLNPKTRG